MPCTSHDSPVNRRRAMQVLAPWRYSSTAAGPGLRMTQQQRHPSTHQPAQAPTSGRRSRLVTSSWMRTPGNAWRSTWRAPASDSHSSRSSCPACGARGGLQRGEQAS